MRALAIDTAGPVMGLSALEYDVHEYYNGPVSFVATVESDTALRHTESLTPALDRVFRETGWSPRSLSGVFVAAGPGSFTGLRIGMAAAKALALVAGCPVVSVDTLEALAISEAMRTELPPERVLVPVMDARKGKLYAAFFRYDSGATGEVLTRLGEDLDVTPRQLVEQLARILSDFPAEENTGISWSLVSTEESPVFTDHLGRHLGDYLAEVPPPTPLVDNGAGRLKSAVRGVAVTGARLCAAGVHDDPYTGPRYLRGGDIGTPGNHPRFL